MNEWRDRQMNKWMVRLQSYLNKVTFIILGPYCCLERLNRIQNSTCAEKETPFNLGLSTGLMIYRYVHSWSVTAKTCAFPCFWVAEALKALIVWSDI